MKSFFLKLCLFSCGLIAAFFLFEISVRVLELAHQTANFYEPDSLIGIKHIPNAHGWCKGKEFRTELRFNAEGFRDTDHSLDKPKGVYRIVLLGDSYAEAPQVSLENTFYKILETKLNESIRGKKIEVMNFGVAGFGVAQDYLALRHYAYKYKPDMVILAVTTGNDIRNAHPDLENDHSKPYFLFDASGNLYLRPFRVQKPGIRRFISDHLFFPHSYVFFVQTIEPLKWQFKVKETMAKNGMPPISADLFVYSIPFTPVWNDAWKVTLALILQMKKETQERGIEFLVVALTDSDRQIDGTLQAYLQGQTKGQSIEWDIEKPVKVLDKFCKENKIDFLPLLYDFRREFRRTHEKFHFIYDGHWNERGHEIAAQAICRKILEDKMVQ